MVFSRSARTPGEFADKRLRQKSMRRQTEFAFEGAREDIRPLMRCSARASTFSSASMCVRHIQTEVPPRACVRGTGQTRGPVVVTEPDDPAPDPAGGAELVRIVETLFQTFRHFRIVAGGDPLFRGIEVQSVDEFQGEMNRDGGGVQRPVKADAGVLRNETEISGVRRWRIPVSASS